MGLWLGRVLTIPAPLHDEAITLLAAKASEQDYFLRLRDWRPPFGVIVPAAQWQDFTRGYEPLTLRAVRDDLRAQDLHPPLGFWLFNLWLSLFLHGGYLEAKVLTLILVLLTAAAVRGSACELGLGAHASAATALLLLSNSAILTATYVRQYALLGLVFALLLWASLRTARNVESGRESFAEAAAIGALALAGMLTQYVFALLAAPLLTGLLLVCVLRKRRTTAVALALSLSLAGVVFLVFQGAGAAAGRRDWGVASGGEALAEAARGFANAFPLLPAGVPSDGALLLGVACIGLLLALAVVAWRSQRALGARLVAASAIATIALLLASIAARVLPPRSIDPAYALGIVILMVLLVGVALAASGRRWLRRMAWLVIVLLAIDEGGYIAWRLVKREPATAQLAARLQPDLVWTDESRRGHLLPLTMAMGEGQQVLVSPLDDLDLRLHAGALDALRTVLVLVEDDASTRRVKTILRMFEGAGWSAERLPTLHPGYHDAVLARHQPRAGAAAAAASAVPVESPR